ncbi:tetratricopeptide repeat protein [Streptomyces sp. OfavH-34-F]|uniref:tetratricopeptide repeat protein n=1 Tax=Streptomyces sp. OfavH-34-F TaxID=2917760 RepID=UPI001EF1A619|nr:tetratricopeptide repeat protein [Streptomyces sp. OfavH-34-F]MCG7524099.1 tetratricopeptide repeat protein [Streptomyces sp. OfavH-34-F]
MTWDTYGFGKELRRRRTEKKISLDTLSAQVFCSRSQLSRVENGTARATPEQAADCDRVLDARGELLALLVDGEPSTPSATGQSLLGLPAPPSPFVGRREELRAVTDHFEGSHDGGSLCVISGMPGAGKTALALQGARAVSDSFPDGCLFLDLGGPSPHGVQGMLSCLLGLIGFAEAQLPSQPDALGNLWRSSIRDKRLLLVLDNVRSGQDIAPLLPAGPSCKVIVTSRRRLSSLDDATHVSVGVPQRTEAEVLFRVVGGKGAAGATQAEARAIVEHCGRLPLAVRIVAGRLRSGSTLSVAELERRLSREAHRLDLLDDGDRSVSAALGVSCHDLRPEQRRLLALLALHPGPSIGIDGVAVLAGITPHRALTLVETLADAYLVTCEPSHRVTMHSLVRQFVRTSLLPAVAVEEQRAALRRLMEHSLQLAVAADSLLTPQRFRPPVVQDHFPKSAWKFSDRAEGVLWLESEWESLVALCRTSADLGLSSMCWQLAFVLRDFFFLTKRWGSWIETHMKAVEAARAAGARTWLAISLSNLGVAHSDRGDLTMAVDCFRQALALYQELEDDAGVVTSVSNLAWAELYLGEYKASMVGLHTALKYYRRTENRRNAAITLRGIALLEAELDRCSAAVEHAGQARAEFHALGLELDAVMSVNCAAWAYFCSGDHRSAAARYEEALTLAESCASSHEQARALTGLGNIRWANGHRQAATDLWERADALCGGLPSVMLGEARVRLAS